MKMNNTRIPEWHDLKTENIIVREIHDPLIELPENSANIIYEPKYALQSIPGATTVCRMRREVFEMLNRALALLPEGFGFKIFDAWRPVSVQKFLFDRYANKLMAEKDISRYACKAICVISREKSPEAVCSFNGRRGGFNNCGS